MVLILSELTYNEIKDTDLYDYVCNNKGFFDFTMDNKNKILVRAEHIVNYYRFYKNTPLNIIILSDKEWSQICPFQFKNSIHISCWCDVPKHLDLSKRLSDDEIIYSEENIFDLMNKLSKVNFKKSKISQQFTLGGDINGRI